MHLPLPAVETLPEEQLMHTDEPAAEYVPAPQARQFAAAVDPITTEYLPAAHVVQAVYALYGV